MIRNAPVQSEEAAEVQAQHPACEQPAEHDRGQQPEQRTQQRGRRVAEGLHHRPQQKCGLDAFAGDRDEADRHERPESALRERAVDPALEARACRVRAVFCIQKIIQVTIATAMSERVPPMISCASKVSEYAPKVSTAPIARASATASPTPAHSRGRMSRRPMRVM